MAELEKLPDEKEAAELLYVPLRTIRHWKGVGQRPLFHKMGRAVRYSREELARFAQGSLRQSTDDREKRQGLKRKTAHVFEHTRRVHVQNHSAGTMLTGFAVPHGQRYRLRFVIGCRDCRKDFRADIE